MQISTPPIPLLILLLSVVPGGSSAQDSPAAAPAAEARSEPSDAQYWREVESGERVPEFHFVLSAEAWKAMQPAGRGRRRVEGGGRGPERGRGPDRRPEGRRREGRSGPARGRGTDYPFARATMLVDGERLEAIGLRFKGNSSFRFAGDSPRKPFKVDTRQFTKGRSFRGRAKLNFSNAFKDPTYLKEKLGYELYRAAGIPTPGVGWAKLFLTVEGEYENKPLGLYVLVEQVDRDLIERRLGKDSKKSLLLKPELRAWEAGGSDLNSLATQFGVKAGAKNAELLGRFRELLDLIETGSDEDFAREIAARVDLDNFASYLAATSLLASLDSFVAAPHNYYLVLDSADGKLRILPWDVNEAFGTFTLGNSPETLARWSIERPWVQSHRILERLFALEGFRSYYRARLGLLLATEFTEAKLFGRIETLRKVVVPALAEDPFGPGQAGFAAGLEGAETATGDTPPGGLGLPLKRFIRARIESVAEQLAGQSKGEVLQGRRRGPPGGGGRGGPPGGRPRRRSPGEERARSRRS